MTTTTEPLGQLAELRTKLTNLVDNAMYRLVDDETSPHHILDRVVDRLVEIADTLAPSTVDTQSSGWVCWIATDGDHVISDYSLNDALTTGAAQLLTDTPTTRTVRWNPTGPAYARVVTYQLVPPPADCPDCGTTRPTRYADETCFTCRFWADQFTRPGGLIINGHHYRIGPEPTREDLIRHPNHYGYYGERFVIRMADGTETVTHNLWGQGPIPARLVRPDNAAFIHPSGGTR
jgi:hypothetical protein